MVRAIDITGVRFGRLTAVALHSSTPRYWLCKCDCGNEHIVRQNCLRDRITQSCGCWNREAVAGRNRKHGLRHNRIYRIWHSMVGRCCNPTDSHYKHYGARGITICERWRSSAANLLADMGEPPAGTSLDRIDNNGNYEPGNCRWATPTQQARNQRGCKLSLEAAADILRHIRQGAHKPTLARQFGVTVAAIYAIEKGKTWIEAAQILETQP